MSTLRDLILNPNRCCFACGNWNLCFLRRAIEAAFDRPAPLLLGDNEFTAKHESLAAVAQRCKRFVFAEGGCSKHHGGAEVPP